MKIAICVGHSRKGDRGAVNTDKVSEWEFNNPISEEIERLLVDAGFTVLRLNKYEGHGYASSINWVAKQLSDFKARAALELHFNSAGADAEGYEFLYWHRSGRAARLASCIHDEFKKNFPDRRSRGLKNIGAGDRGSIFLQKTPCPAVIVEPYFGSNSDETAYYRDKVKTLAKAYVDGIISWSSCEKP